VYALDADTGRVVWRAVHPAVEMWAPPLYYDGKVLFMHGSAGWLHVPRSETDSQGVWCHDAATGKLLWYVPMILPTQLAGPVAHKDRMFLMTQRDGVLSGIALSLTTGDVIWRRQYTELPSLKDAASRYPQIKAADLGDEVLTCGVFGDGRWYLSAAIGIKAKGWGLTGQPGRITLAIDPDTGDIIWKNAEQAIAGESRVHYRKGVLLVLSRAETHALNAATGALLWSSKRMCVPTDDYLESKGAKGPSLYKGCGWPAPFANGVSYANTGGPSHRLVGYDKDRKPVWQRDFLGHACVAAAIAYGRLYYSPTGEGVVYCFEPAELPPSTQIRKKNE
jgi:outer membrane protein assembly factor BamB